MKDKKFWMVYATVFSGVVAGIIIAYVLFGVLDFTGMNQTKREIKEIRRNVKIIDRSTHSHFWK